MTRPRIICHMVSSIDGRLLVKRWTALATGIAPDLTHQHYNSVAARLNADGWLVGRKTMEAYAKGEPRQAESAEIVPRADYIADRAARSIAVVFDPSGRLHYGADTIEGDHIVAVLGQNVPDSYLAELRADGVSYVFAGADGGDLSRAVATLGRSFAIQTLLLEGGGRINGAFLKAGLIDELSIIICPVIDGLSGVPSIFDYAGSRDEQPASGQTLRHLATEPLEGGFVWLRYQLERAGSPKA